MRTGQVKLPSGCEIELRGTTLKEENMLASTTGKKADEALNNVLKACSSIVNPGPYAFMNEGSKPQYAKMLTGDRFVAMINMRILSHKDGHIYEFRSQCPHCDEWTYYEADLVKDFPVRDMPKEWREKFEAGEDFEVTVAGKVVSFGFAMCSDAEKFKAMKKRFPKRKMTAGLVTRVRKIEGVHISEKIDWLDGEGKGKYPGLSSEEGDELREALEEYDVGIDTELELECPECNKIFELDLPFERSFWAPNKALKKKKLDRHLANIYSEPEAENSSSE